MTAASPDVAEKALTAARAAQLVQLIKDNQLMTALGLLSSGRPAHLSPPIRMFKEACVDGEVQLWKAIQERR